MGFEYWYTGNNVFVMTLNIISFDFVYNGIQFKPFTQSPPFKVSLLFIMHRSPRFKTLCALPYLIIKDHNNVSTFAQL